MFMSIISSVMYEQSIAPFTASVLAFVNSLGIFFPIIMIGLCLVVGLFGRRLSDVIRVLLLFAVGFVASVHWVAPFVQGVVPAIPAYVVGITCGIVVAVLSRMIYNLVYIGCIGFDTYNICMNALFVVELTSYTKGNLPVSIAVAVIVTIIALVLRKYLEMILTAGIGGIGAALLLKKLYDYTVFVNFAPMTTAILLGAVIAIPMFIYQYYNRVLY